MIKIEISALKKTSSAWYHIVIITSINKQCGFYRKDVAMNLLVGFLVQFYLQASWQETTIPPGNIMINNLYYISTFTIQNLSLLHYIYLNPYPAGTESD